MQDLHRDPPARVVHRLRHLPVVRHILVGEQPRGPRHHTALAVRRHATCHHQGNTALGATRVIGCDTVEVAQLLQPCMHRPHQNTVRQGHVAKIERAEKMRIICHGATLPKRAPAVI